MVKAASMALLLLHTAHQQHESIRTSVLQYAWKSSIFAHIHKYTLTLSTQDLLFDIRTVETIIIYALDE